MSDRRRAGLIVGLACAGLVLAPTAAHATDQGETKTIEWVIQDGSPDNVTWPQVEYTGQPVRGDVCWLQVDTYPYTSDEDKARTDALNDDDLLTYKDGRPEDAGWVLNWTFRQIECYIEPTPSPTPSESSSPTPEPTTPTPTPPPSEEPSTPSTPPAPPVEEIGTVSETPSQPISEPGSSSLRLAETGSDGRGWIWAGVLALSGVMLYVLGRRKNAHK